MAGTTRLPPISIATATFAMLALFVLPFVDLGRAQDASDPQLEGAKRSFAAKQAQIFSSIVTPCKDKVEEIAKPAEKHIETCDCGYSAPERQELLAKLRSAEQQDLARCEIKGLDAQISYIDKREAAVRAALVDMISKFKEQAGAYGSWGADAERGKKEAQDKIGQILISSSLGAMVDDIINANEEEMSRRLDEVVEHAESRRDVRRVRTGGLKELAVAMKRELAGKSKAEAKEIILHELKAAKLGVTDASDIEKRVAEGIIDANIPRDEAPSAEEKTQSYLEGDYATLLTVIKIAARHGAEDAKIFAKAADVLAFAPDAIDAAAILYNASAIGDNVSGLDRLRAAAEEQREALSAEMTVLVAQRRAISAQRSSIANGKVMGQLVEE